MSGYDLKLAIHATFGHFWTESFGQIYPELRRLAAAGLVAAVPVGAKENRPVAPASRSRRGAPRQAYRLTAAGRDYLDDWLLAPARSQVHRNELLLKLYFAGERTPAIGLAHIARQRGELKRRLALLSRVEARLRHVLEETPALAGWLAGVRHGVLLAEAGLRWCDEAEELLTMPINRSAS